MKNKFSKSSWTIRYSIKWFTSSPGPSTFGKILDSLAACRQHLSTSELVNTQRKGGVEQTLHIWLDSRVSGHSNSAYNRKGDVTKWCKRGMKFYLLLYPRQGGYVFGRNCLSVCLSVCLFLSKKLRNYWTDFGWNFHEWNAIKLHSEIVKLLLEKGNTIKIIICSDN